MPNAQSCSTTGCFENGGRIRHLKLAEIMPSNGFSFVSGGKRLV